MRSARERCGQRLHVDEEPAIGSPTRTTARKLDERGSAGKMLHPNVGAAGGKGEAESASHLPFGESVSGRDARDVERQIEADDQRANVKAPRIDSVLDKLGA